MPYRTLIYTARGVDPVDAMTNMLKETQGACKAGSLTAAYRVTHSQMYCGRAGFFRRPMWAYTLVFQSETP